jgi:hypothetical protein
LTQISLLFTVTAICYFKYCTSVLILTVTINDFKTILWVLFPTINICSLLHWIFYEFIKFKKKNESKKAAEIGSQNFATVTTMKCHVIEYKFETLNTKVSQTEIQFDSENPIFIHFSTSWNGLNTKSELCVKNDLFSKKK